MAAGDLHRHMLRHPECCAAPPIFSEMNLRDPGSDGPWIDTINYAKIANATLVDVDNVAHYYFETMHDKWPWSLDEDFKGVTPPFERLFLEGTYPKRVFLKNTGEWVDCVAENERAHGATPKRFAVVVTRRDMRKIVGTRYERVMQLQQYANDESAAFCEVREGLLGARWNVRMHTLIWLGDHVLGPMAVNDFYVDDVGNVITKFDLVPGFGVSHDPKKVLTTTSFLSHPHNMTDEQMGRYYDMASSVRPFVDIAFLALSFMNCRNVSLRQVAPKPLTKKQRKRGDVPRVAHHVIEIEPMRPRVVGNAGAGPVIGLDSGKKSLHIVRGHFKHFGPEWGTKKLFGRVSGKFWWEKMTRGSIDVGLVESDYAVKP